MNPTAPTLSLFCLTLAFAAAQDPATDPLHLARERLAKAIATTAALPSCAFESTWGPAPKADDDKDDEQADPAQVRLIAAMGGAGSGTGKADGCWNPDLLHCKTGDDELLFANRRLLAKSANAGWTLRHHRFADGAEVQFMPDPQLLLDLLAGFGLAVTHTEVATLNDRPVEILSVTLDQDQAAALIWGGQLPENINGFGGGAVFVAMAGGGGGGARPAPQKPEATIDLAIAIDPASGQIHQIRARSYGKNEMNIGGRVIRMRAGGGGAVMVGGADEEEEEDEKADAKAAAPLVYKDGLPQRSRKKMAVNDFTLSFRDHGQAKVPELDAAAKALLRAR